MSWQNGKYILVDGEFNEVISKRGFVYKVKQIGKVKEYYLVTDGNGKYAHGDTIKDAKEDLIYKLSNRSKSDFDGLNPDERLSFEKAIECYRVITGACSVGVKNFIDKNNIEKKEYSINDIIFLTSKEYGGDSFSRFFKTK